jgi:hypothetical protein
MRNGGLDLLLVLTVLLAVGTIIQDYRFDSSIARERAAATDIDRQLGSLDLAVAEMAAASTGAIADPTNDSWSRRVSDLAARIDTTVGELRATSTNPAVRARYDAAVTALADVLTIDRRARDALHNNQRSLAAGLVRVDSREAADRLAGELAAARAEEDAAVSVRLARLARLRFGMNAVAIAWVVIVALFAGRLAKRPAGSPAATMAQMLRELPPPVKTPAPAPVRAAPPPPPPPPAPPPQPVHLAAAADLCVDLARLIDSRDLPGLLERTAKVLEAKGVIVWTADREGTSLRPTLTHGYSERVLERLGTLGAGDDNVTSLAFRSGCTQTMNGAAPQAAGAIAVPLMTATGCAGVLAVEVRETTPPAELTAMTTILAAQFSTMVGPGDEPSAQAAEA